MVGSTLRWCVTWANFWVSTAEEHYTHDYPDEDVDYSSDQEEFGSDGDLEEGFRGEGPGSDSEDEYGEDDDTDEDEDW